MKKEVRFLSKTVFIAVIIVLLTNFSYMVLASIEQNSEQEVTDNEQMVYLSDIQYKTAQVGWGQLTMDKTAANTLISMYLDGNLVNFRKGIWAHATSTLVYDLTNYDYDYFSTYYGVCTTSGNKGDGVKFYIYTSTNGNDWTLQTEENPVALKSNDGARFIKIDIRNSKYIKLYADKNGSNGNDHAVYADCKLFKEGYSDNVTKTVEEYDELIKSKNTSGTINEELELLILQREFVNNIGQYQLREFFAESKDNGNYEQSKETFNWLFNNIDILRLYIAGGKPDGTYVKSLQVLTDLYTAYKSDLSVTNTTASGVSLSDIYTKMIISLSLTHSQTVGFWIHSNPPEGQNAPEPNPNISIAKNRYAIYKELFADGKINTSIFENLEVEEMRYIMGSFINDDEIKWACDYANSKTNKLSGYSYMGYKNVNTALYRSDKFYGEGRKDYEEQYKLTGYDVKNEKYYPRLWMIMNIGGVCWQISNVGQNMVSSMGIPSTLVGQPGHSAYLVYGVDANGNGTWSLWNDVGGWTKTNTSGYTGTKSYYTVRLINDWGKGSYASANKGSYILLGQAAINDYDNYVKAKENVMLANTYIGNNQKMEEAYRKALSIQSFNLDAWVGLINLYINDSTKTEEELYNLAVELTNSLKYYPLPMSDLLKLINNKITSPAYKMKFTLLETNTLKQASVATDAEIIQSNVVRIMANYLLGNLDTKVADFSFDGENAGVLALSSRYEASNAHWDYSLDGGKTWTEVDEQSKRLSEEELSMITVENDIKVHIIGVNYDEANIYTIDILRGSTPTGLYNNDLENKVIGANDKMQWRFSDDEQWTSYKDSLPDLTGNKQVQVRIGSTGIYLPSDSVTYSFTEDNQQEERKYIPISHLSLHSVSSQEGGKDNHAKYAIDGNINTIWHTAWNGSDTQREIVIKLDEPFYVSALEYVPRQDASNGRLKNGKLSVSMDGENWTEVETISNWANNGTTKVIDLDEPVKAQYVKLQATEGYGGSYFSASMINLFEDSTKKTGPTANVTYSTTELTSQDVIATIKFSEEVTILNENIELQKQEDGSYAYIFKSNGEFTLEFEGSYGQRGTIDLSVDWIDKEKPTAEISYDIEKLTNQDVIATIKFSEEVTIQNGNLQFDEESGNYTYTFTENSGFCLKFVDTVGNEGQAEVSVNWIDKETPNATVLYSTTESTNQDVTVTIKFDKQVTILNEDIELQKQEDGSYIYTFKENGEITIEGVDEAGNIGYAVAEVNWITKEQETIKGDIDGDGEATVNDLAKLKLHLIEETILTGKALKSADLDGDGEVTINDLAQLKLLLIS